MEQIDRAAPDLILLDYYLPGMRGDELCRRIRMNIDTRGIPILMMTVEETDEAEIRGLESGADDFVPKSVDPDILLLRIRTLLTKSLTQAAILGRADSHFRHARLLTIDDSRDVPRVPGRRTRAGGLPDRARDRRRAGAGVAPARSVRLRAGGPGDAGHERHRGVPPDQRAARLDRHAGRGPHAHRAREQGRPDPGPGGRGGRLRRQVERRGRAEGAHPRAASPQVLPGGEPPDPRGTQEQGTGGDSGPGREGSGRDAGRAGRRTGAGRGGPSQVAGGVAGGEGRGRPREPGQEARSWRT